MSEAKRDYEVDRGKPHSRFKKSQSGNPRGPRTKSLPALLVDALNEKVVATIDGQRREIAKREAVVTLLVNKSTGADQHATKILIDMLKDAEKKAGMTPPPEAAPFTAADEEVMANFENGFVRLSKETAIRRRPHAHRYRVCSNSPSAVATRRKRDRLIEAYRGADRGKVFGRRPYSGPSQLTSSAVTSGGATVMRSAVAVFRLIASSKLVDAGPGRSLGVAPWPLAATCWFCLIEIKDTGTDHGHMNIRQRFGGQSTDHGRTTVYKNILIPTDGSELAGKAVDHGVVFAKEIGAKITAVTVTEPFHVFSVAPSQLEYTRDEYKRHIEAYAAKASADVAAAAQSAGVACETRHVEHEHIYQAIIETAASNGCDLILMASHGSRGVSAIVLGSETVKVLTHSKIPVLVYR